MDASEQLRHVGEVLALFDAEVLERCCCYFAGGCRLAFDLGAHRVSRVLDFLCSDAAGYRELRTTVHDHGYAGLFGQQAASMDLPREIRADAYGIRFPVVLDQATVRVELAREARVALHDPARVAWSVAPCLSILDCYTEKLLANSDRGADLDELSRDLIDLAALRLAHGPVPDDAWAAAIDAYGPSVRIDVARGADRFLSDRAYRARCEQGLQVRDLAAILRGVELLRRET
jgi:Nucleotidyl transferase AbiEii toxin, Type IV TA system